eukprot:588896-Rhodomonas_salina.2
MVKAPLSTLSALWYAMAGTDFAYAETRWGFLWPGDSRHLPSRGLCDALTWHAMVPGSYALSRWCFDNRKAVKGR